MPSVQFRFRRITQGACIGALRGVPAAGVGAYRVSDSAAGGLAPFKKKIRKTYIRKIYAIML